MMYDKPLSTLHILGIVVSSLLLFVLMLGGGCYTYPIYRVYRLDMEGQAQLAKAKNERKVQIEQARADSASSVLWAEQERIRARGLADAIQIVSGRLKDNDEYLRYLWIESLKHESTEVIYVPTETQLPILEAVRHLKKK